MIGRAYVHIFFLCMHTEMVKLLQKLLHVVKIKERWNISSANVMTTKPPHVYHMIVQRSQQSASIGFSERNIGCYKTDRHKYQHESTRCWSSLLFLYFALFHFILYFNDCEILFLLNRPLKQCALKSKFSISFRCAKVSPRTLFTCICVNKRHVHRFCFEPSMPRCKHIANTQAYTLVRLFCVYVFEWSRSHSCCIPYRFGGESCFGAVYIIDSFALSSFTEMCHYTHFF